MENERDNRRDGFQLNTGATLLAGGYATMVEMARELGACSQVDSETVRLTATGGSTARFS